MLKVKLELEALQVDSFATSDERNPWAGTVEAYSRHRAVSFSCYGGSCYDATCVDGSCPYTCGSCDTICVSCDTNCGSGGGSDDTACDRCQTITLDP